MRESVVGLRPVGGGHWAVGRNTQRGNRRRVGKLAQPWCFSDPSRSPGSGYAQKHHGGHQRVVSLRLGTDISCREGLISTILHHHLDLLVLFTISGASSKTSLLEPNKHQHPHHRQPRSSIPVDTMASSRTTVCASRESPVPGHKIRQVWTPEEDRLLSEAVARGESPPAEACCPPPNH
jgi:hypothetical protein